MSDLPPRAKNGSQGAPAPSEEAVHRALQEAVKSAIVDHKRAENPIATWRDGHVVWIPPERISVGDGQQRRDAASATVRVSTPTDYERQLRRFHELLDGAQLKLNPSSRLAFFEQRNADFAAQRLHVVSGVTETNEALIEGGRDFAELSVAAEALLPTSDPVILRKFKHALSGASSANGESHAGPRSTQFELFFAGLLKTAGADVLFAEPDLRIRCSEVELGIAVKRILSTDRISREVHEGGKQIQRQGLRGFVALSLDHLVGTDEYRVATVSQEELLLHAWARAKSLIDQHTAEILRRTADLPVLGLYVSFVQLGIVPHANAIGHAELVYPVPFRDRWTASDVAALQAMSRQLHTPPSMI
jgi:hypothetical protein